MKTQYSDRGPEILTMQNCTDEAADREVEAIVASRTKATCPKIDSKKTVTATGYVIDSVCSGAGTPTTWHTEFTGDYNSAYTMKTTSHREGGPTNPPRDVTTTLEAKWLGPCKADQKPGDIWDDGFKLTIEGMKRMMELLPK